MEEDLQKIFMITLMIFAIASVFLYMLVKGFDDSFVKEIIISLWAIVLLAIGASFRKLNLSKAEEKKLE